MPPDEVLDLVARLGRHDHDDLRWTRRDQWHITLCFLGAVGDHLVPALIDALGQLGRLAPVTATLGPATGRFRRSVLHIPVLGLEGLAGDVGRSLNAVDLEPTTSEATFAGHLTLARARGRHGSPLIPDLAGCTVEPRSWTVDRVALVSSVLTASGARHSKVTEIPLCGQVTGNDGPHGPGQPWA